MTVVNPFAAAAEAETEAPAEAQGVETEVGTSTDAPPPMNEQALAIYQILAGQRYSWKEARFAFGLAMLHLKANKELVRHSTKRGIFKQPIQLNFGDEIIIGSSKRKPDFCVIHSKVKFIRFVNETGRIIGMDENSNIVHGKYVRHTTQED